jgi:predicted amidohydrolase YtcJ
VEAASLAYAATGTGCVRDCYVPIPDIDVLVATHKAKKLNVRVRALVPTIGLTTVEQVERLLDNMEQYRHLQADPWLSVWGVKFMVDGGIEAGATLEPYLVVPSGQNSDCNCCGLPSYHGILIWEKSKLVEAMHAVLRRGWKIGTHAYGDRATKLVLDAYETLMQRFPYLPRETLVMEHGALISESEQHRAVNLGIAITIQHPLLYDAAGIQEVYWGYERVARTFPARKWLDAGALIAGGSDYPVGSFAAMRSIWGMSTRETVAGVRGQEHAITVAEAIYLHTTKAAQLLCEDGSRGRLLPGFVADLAIWDVNPLKLEDLSSLKNMSPSYVCVGKKVVST